MEFQKLQKLIAGILKIPEGEITENARIAEDLYADSMELFQILTETEKEFERTLSFGSIDSIRTVGDLLELIRER